RRACSLGEASLPDTCAAARPLSAGQRLHRDSPCARSDRLVPERAPRAAVLLEGDRRENAEMTALDCVFCDLAKLRLADVYFENGFCVYAATRDPRDPPDVLPGSGIVVPIAHRASPFDFTAEEWVATGELLVKAKAAQTCGWRRTATSCH